jgi:hypothetical protein
MSKKSIYKIVSALMLAVLVLSACRQSPTTAVLSNFLYKSVISLFSANSPESIEPFT